ncbi:9178_t:CDS:1, partial [Acaulospora colombiana]
LAPNSTHHVDSLPLEKSTALLLESSGYKNNEANQQFAEKIATELGCLPLALAHAGAYILSRQCLDTYLETYRENHSQLLECKFNMLHDYPHSVATTVEMSFKKLSTRVQDLLGLLSHLDARSIPRSIIEKAALRRFRHVAKVTELPLKRETVEYADALTRIITPQGDWSSFDFDAMIKECEKYSLVRSAIQDEEKFYSMHILVQSFVQASYGVVLDHPSSRLVARLLGSAITVGTRWEYITFNRSLSPHLRLIGLDDVTETGDHYGFGIVFVEVGEGQQAVSHMDRCVEIWTGSLEADSMIILHAMETLAQSYSTVGKEEKALKLREDVLEKCKSQLGDDHLDTITAVNNLAFSYSKLGREKDALPLSEDVVEKRRRLLDDDHPHTLAAVNNLATSYSKLGREKDALPLKEDVVEKRRKLLGDDHLDTLVAVSNLAT